MGWARGALPEPPEKGPTSPEKTLERKVCSARMTVPQVNPREGFRRKSVQIQMQQWWENVNYRATPSSAGIMHVRQNPASMPAPFPSSPPSPPRHSTKDRGLQEGLPVQERAVEFLGSWVPESGAQGRIPAAWGAHWSFPLTARQNQAGLHGGLCLDSLLFP